MVKTLMATAAMGLGLSLANAQTAAPSVNYTSFEANSASATQIGYYGTAHKDCSPAAPPYVSVVEPPRAGVLTIRAGELTTRAVKGCGTLKLPARVLFYRPRAGATGTDHFIYKTTDASGAVSGYDVTITIRDAPKTPLGAGDKPI